MTAEQTSVDERIKNVKQIYDQIDKLIDFIPEKYAKIIKDLVFNDKDLQRLINNLDKYRSPRILLIGRTGFGKSSLINALMGRYVAQVSDVKSCTGGTTKYKYSGNGGMPLEILDTRGISESLPVDETKNAEQQILADVEAFDPDIALFVLSCTSRDGIDDDIDFMKQIRKVCYQKNAVELPIVVAINKADAVAPSREPIPYSNAKLQNINAIKNNMSELFSRYSLNTSLIIPVSSCIDWKDEKGNELKTANQLNALTEEQRLSLSISFDGRYRIDELERGIEAAITDNEANMGMKLVFHLNEVLEIIARKLIVIFCTISAALVGFALPVTDYVALLAMESLLVALIMALAGRKLSLNSAKEFIASLTGTAAAGLAFREVARIALKFIPIAGNVISAAVAVAGVKTIGEAAIQFFIEGVDIKTVCEKYLKQTKKEKRIGTGKAFVDKVTGVFKKDRKKK